MASSIIPRDGLAGYSRRYLAALRAHVNPAAEPRRGTAGRLGLRACELGIETLALARIHDTAFAALPPPKANGTRARRSLAVRAESFFAEALAPIEASHHPGGEGLSERGRPGRSPDREAVELATAAVRLTQETGRRRVAQEALATSQSEHRVLLERSDSMEERLRHLSRSLLMAHEEERKRISRELHDTLGQTLSAVNVALASLKPAGQIDSKEFRTSVARAQRLVQMSMRTVHQFARSLRPALLDDLGLLPALLSFAKEFGKQHGIKMSVSAPEEETQFDGDRRTALFRVAQEALVNVGRHARARNVRVTLCRTADGVSLEIWNDGSPFDVEQALRSKTNRHLGLLCMRERMEMVGGTFSVRSSKEGGTTVRADVPLPGEPH